MKHVTSLVYASRKIFPIRIDILENEHAVFNTGFGDTWEDFKDFYLNQYWVTTEMLEYLKEHFDSIKEEAMRIRIKDML